MWQVKNTAGLVGILVGYIEQIYNLMEQISKYIEDKETQVCHCWRKCLFLSMEKGKSRKNVDWNFEILAGMHGFKIYTLIEACQIMIGTILKL